MNLARPHPSWRSLETGTGRFRELDGLRGVAILLVILFHYLPGIPGPAPGTLGAYVLAPFARLGWSGVDLFFVLSGYLITSICLDHGASPGFVAKFLARRGARILPLYILVIGALLAGHQIWRETLPRLFGEVRHWWAYLALVQNDFFALGQEINFGSVSWSVAIELKFYLLLAMLVALTLHWGMWPSVEQVLLASFLIVIVLAIVVRSFKVGPDTFAWGYYATLCRLDALATGGVTCLIERWWPASKRAHAVAAASFFLAMLLAFELKYNGYWGAWRYTIFAAFYATVLLLALDARTIVARVLRARFFAYCGTVSYGLYLHHIPALGLAMAFLYDAQQDILSQRPVALTLVASVAAFVTAQVSWQLIEAPILKWVHARTDYARPPQSKAHVSTLSGSHPS